MPSKKPHDDDGESPYPDFAAPSLAEVQACHDALIALHGTPTRGESVMPVLDSLVRTILSQNTTDKNSRAAFLSLKNDFPTWKEVHAAHGTGRVEAAIKCGGLSEIKARNIFSIIDYLLKQHGRRCMKGEPSYDWLRELTTAEVKAELQQHKGVGPKTISCVLMFNMNRSEFPVDTHVLHIAKTRLGWLPSAATAETAYLHLNSRIPAELKYPIHVLLVEHGKRCPKCAKGALQLPQEGPCPLGAALKESRDKRSDRAGSRAGVATTKRGREEAAAAAAGLQSAVSNECKDSDQDQGQDQDQDQDQGQDQDRKGFADMCGNDCDDLYVKPERAGSGSGSASKKKLRHVDLQG